MAGKSGKPAAFSTDADAEIAKHLLSKLDAGYDYIVRSNNPQNRLPRFVFDEGNLYQWSGTHWALADQSELERMVMVLQGAPIGTGDQKRPLKVSNTKVDAVIGVMHRMARWNEFFASAERGANCQNGFVRLDLKTGDVKLVAHDPAHRQRFVIPADYRAEYPEARCPNWHKLIDGAFPIDIDGESEAEAKRRLLAQIAGVVLFGLARDIRQPILWFWHAPRARNGKDTIASVLSALLPAEAVTAVPLDQMRHQHERHALVGARLNKVSEVDSTRALSGTWVKAVVTCDKILANKKHQDSFLFRPEAQTIALCQNLPVFEGGADNGVLARLGILRFAGHIPVNQRDPALAQKIINKELGAVLAFAVAGAQDLVRNDLMWAKPASSIAAFEKWAKTADPISSWVDARIVFDVTHDKTGATLTALLRHDLEAWAIEEGYDADKLPGPRKLVERLEAFDQPGRPVFHKKIKNGLGGIYGVRLREAHDDVREAAVAANDNVVPMSSRRAE